MVFLEAGVGGKEWCWREKRIGEAKGGVKMGDAGIIHGG